MVLTNALVADDIAMNRKVLGRILRLKFGSMVKYAENGTAAIDLVKKRKANGMAPFDCIFMGKWGLRVVPCKKSVCKHFISDVVRGSFDTFNDRYFFTIHVLWHCITILDNQGCFLSVGYLRE